MAQDKYFGLPVQLADPANEAVAIVNGVDYTGQNFRSMYVGVAGDISMKGTDDADFKLWKAVPAGAVLPFRVVAVQAPGTTATNLLGLK